MNDLVCINPECRHVGLRIISAPRPVNKFDSNPSLWRVLCPHCLMATPAGENEAQALAKYQNLKFAFKIE